MQHDGNERRTVFYSWQSQLPNATNRSFIESALEAAVKELRDDTSLEVRPEVDKDTANVPGAPNIADTIRAKIDRAEVVVCDVSIVQGLNSDRTRDRPTPNPNVLIELGYALKSLGTPDRLILVVNTAFGGVENLPFDLRQHRTTPYHLPEGLPDGAPPKATERKKLTAALVATLKQVLGGPSRNAPQTTPVVVSSELMLDPIEEMSSQEGRPWRKARLGVRLSVAARGVEWLKNVVMGVVFLSADRLYDTESELPEWVANAIDIRRSEHHRVLSRPFVLGDLAPGVTFTTDWWHVHISVDHAPWRAVVYVVAEGRETAWFHLEVSREAVSLVPTPGQGVQVRGYKVRETLRPVVSVGDQALV
jgi:hypothetical protein